MTIRLLATTASLWAACSASAPPLEQKQRLDRDPIGVALEQPIAAASEAAFSRYVQAKIAVWDDGLEALGCEPPLAFALEGSEFLVVLGRNVTNETTLPNGGGYFDGRAIHLQADADGTYDSTIRMSQVIILEHELGHILGLPHNSRPDSVMSVVAYVHVSPSDLEDAASSIGCD